MIESPHAGVVAWKVRPGDEVRAGDVLGEVVDVEWLFSGETRSPSPTPSPLGGATLTEEGSNGRYAVRSRTDGIVLTLQRLKLVRPGQVIAKVAGKKALSWRTGNLLPL